MDNTNLYYHFNKNEKIYCNCLFYDIYDKEEKYLVLRMQLEETDDIYDSLDDYDDFCTIAYFNLENRQQYFKVSDLHNYDTRYNLIKYISGLNTMQFYKRNPEDSFQLADKKLNNFGRGRIKLHLSDVNKDTPEGHYWTDYPIDYLEDIYYQTNERIL